MKLINIWFKDKAEQENFFYNTLSKLLSIKKKKFCIRINLNYLKKNQNILQLCENSLIITMNHNIYYEKMTLNLFKQTYF